MADKPDGPAKPSIPDRRVKSDLPIDVLAYSLPGMAAVTVRHGVFRVADGKPLTMDIFYPPELPNDAAAPAVIFVTAFPDTSPVTKGHPLKDLDSYISWGRLTAAAGLIAVTYQTEHADDLEALVAHIRDHAASLHISRDRLGIWSCSANGLAASSFVMGADRSYLRFAVFYYSLMLNPGDWLRQEINALCDQYGCYSAELRSISRIPTALPLLIVKCGRDTIPFVNDSIGHFAGLARAGKAQLTLIEFEAGVHAFDVEQRTDPRAAEIVKQTLEFMKKHATTIQPGPPERPA